MPTPTKELVKIQEWNVMSALHFILIGVFKSNDYLCRVPVTLSRKDKLIMLSAI